MALSTSVVSEELARTMDWILRAVVLTLHAPGWSRALGLRPPGWMLARGGCAALRCRAHRCVSCRQGRRGHCHVESDR